MIFFEPLKKVAFSLEQLNQKVYGSLSDLWVIINGEFNSVYGGSLDCYND